MLPPIKVTDVLPDILSHRAFMRGLMRDFPASSIPIVNAYRPGVKV